MSVLCRARLTVYAPRGEYQLIVEAVEPRGVGALQKAFEQLKQRLQAEGLFDPARKKPVPFLPRRIGVITSPTGAVIRDILTVTRRRFSSVPLLIAPVRVQGVEAPPEIVAAIQAMQNMGDIDVIILARGGGSLEDLAPFNDESVARAIFRSDIPVVSAVGHETDFTIADFVADLRAPTPSAAAELILPVRQDLLASLDALRMRMNQRRRRMMMNLQEHLSGLRDRLKDPKRRLADSRLRVDDRLERLQQVLNSRIAMQRQSLAQREARLRHAGPQQALRNRQFALENLRRSMIAKTLNTLENLKNRLHAGTVVLDSLSPLAVLGRGYAIARRLPDGRIIRDAGDVAPGEDVRIRVSSGYFDAQVMKVCGDL
jgi:exodeoxyribonuclease VII large subunit